MTPYLKELFTVELPRDREEELLEEYVLERSSLFFSKKAYRRACKEKRILVNDRPVDRLYCARDEDRVETRLLEPDPGPAFQLPLKVLFEDPWCAVVEKIPGYRVNGNLFQSIENALPFNLEKSTEKGAMAAPRPVHRLDKATGGLLLVAKTREAMINLSRQFQMGEVYKAYEALLAGDPGPHGRITSPVEGRDAVTEYFSINSVPSLKNGRVTLARLYPKTGRKHQLRRHCSEISAPVMGDTLYGEEGKVLRGKGLFLWSVYISFRHPFYGYPVTVTIKHPEKFTAMMHREERRWKKYN